MTIVTVKITPPRLFLQLATFEAPGVFEWEREQPYDPLKTKCREISVVHSPKT